MKRVLRQAWDSPTVTTWASLTTRFAGLVLVLPLVLRRFDTAEIAVWLLFGVVLNLQILGDLGFSQSFTRAVAHAFGGTTLKEFGQVRGAPASDLPNRPLHVGELLGTMRRVFQIATASFFILLTALGSVLLERPISQLDRVADGWLAWAAVVVATTATVWGNFYTGYLIGANEIPTVKRWETAFGAAAVLSTTLALLAHPSPTLLELVLLQQFWVIVGCIRNGWLYHHRTLKIAISISPYNAAVFKAIWPSSWRGGLGVTMSVGIVYLSGLLLAWLAPASQVAPYLLALRVVQAVSQFSQAPFYSKLPVLNRHYAQGRLRDQIQIARRGMRLAHITYAIGFLTVGLFAWPLLRLVSSNTEFVSPLMWAAMGFAFFVERLGAMHLQLYSTTNHIIWHIANGVTGAVMLTIGIVAFPKLNIYAFPLAMIVAYSLIYAPTALTYSGRAFNLNLMRFESTVSLMPGLAIICYGIAAGLQHT